jgi:hypothetical protein
MMRCPLIKKPIPFLGVGLLVLFFGGSQPSAASGGQNIRIRVRNGRNGHPVTKESVNVWFGNKPAGEGFGGEGGVALLLSTDKNGEVLVSIKGNDAEWIDILPDYYFDCRARKDTRRPIYSVKEVLQSGVVTDNTCGKFTAEPKPGEITFFVRPLHWWEAFQR